MKHKISISVLTFALCSTGVMADSLPLKDIKPKNQIELLFFHQADTGLIRLSKTTGCYDLALSGLSPNVLYFSNSPSKVAGNLTLPQYVETMQHSQTADHIKPNAVVNMFLQVGPRQQQVNMIGSLSDTHYVNKKMHYTLCPFEQNQEIRAGKLRRINLFVDPIHRWPP